MATRPFLTKREIAWIDQATETLSEQAATEQGLDPETFGLALIFAGMAWLKASPEYPRLGNGLATQQGSDNFDEFMRWINAR